MLPTALNNIDNGYHFHSITSNNRNKSNQYQSEIFIGEIELEKSQLESVACITYPSTIQSDNVNIVKSESCSSGTSELTANELNDRLSNSRNNCLENDDKLSLFDMFDVEIEVSLASNDYKYSVEVPQTKSKLYLCNDEGKNYEESIIIIENETRNFGSNDIFILKSPTEDKKDQTLSLNDDQNAKSLTSTTRSLTNVRKRSRLKNSSLFGSKSKKIRKNACECKKPGYFRDFLNNVMQNIAISSQEYIPSITEISPFRRDATTSPINLDKRLSDSTWVIHNKSKCDTLSKETEQAENDSGDFGILDNLEKAPGMGDKPEKIKCNSERESKSEGITNYESIVSDSSTENNKNLFDNSFIVDSIDHLFAKHSKQMFDIEDIHSLPKLFKQTIRCNNSQIDPNDKDINYNSVDHKYFKKDVKKSLNKVQMYINQMKSLSNSKFKANDNDSDIVIKMKKHLIDELLQGLIQSTVTQTNNDLTTGSEISNKIQTNDDNSHSYNHNNPFNNGCNSGEGMFNFVENTWESFKRTSIYHHFCNNSLTNNAALTISKVIFQFNHNYPRANIHEITDKDSSIIDE